MKKHHEDLRSWKDGRHTRNSKPHRPSLRSFRDDRQVITSLGRAAARPEGLRIRNTSEIQPPKYKRWKAMNNERNNSPFPRHIFYRISAPRRADDFFRGIFGLINP